MRLGFTATDLAGKQKRSPSFNGSPDYIITTFPHATVDDTNVGFGEVKWSTMADDHFLVNWDLMHLTMFGKGALNSNGLSANLAIHIIGRLDWERAKKKKKIESEKILLDTLHDEIKKKE